MAYHAGCVTRTGRGSRMDTDHARLYVAMADKFLDRADIVAPSSGCVSDKWPLWVKCRRRRGKIRYQSGRVIHVG